MTETGVKARMIAEHILHAFKSRKVKGKSLISKAKMDRGSSSAQGKRGFSRRKR